MAISIRAVDGLVSRLVQQLRAEESAAAKERPASSPQADKAAPRDTLSLRTPAEAAWDEPTGYDRRGNRR